LHELVAHHAVTPDLDRRRSRALDRGVAEGV